MLRSIARCWLVIGSLCTTAVSAGEAPLRFGVFPRWNAQTMVENFTPLARELEQSLGREIRVESDKDFDSFMRRVYAGEFDLVHLNQLQYLQARNAAGYRAIAKLCEQPDCTIRAVIVTRTDSGVNALADLRGRSVAFGDRNALVSYLLARRLLHEAGLGPDDYRSVFTKNPPNALLTVYNGAAAAAGVGSSVLKRREITGRIDVGRLRVLAESAPIQPLPIAVRAGFDAPLAGRLRTLLLELDRVPAGAEVLAKIGAIRFAAADEADYAAFEDLAADERDAAP